MTLAALTMLGVGSGPIISLLIFVGVFIAVVTYVFMVPKSTWQKDANLPLETGRESQASKENSHVSKS